MTVLLWSSSLAVQNPFSLLPYLILDDIKMQILKGKCVLYVVWSFLLLHTWASRAEHA